MNNLVTVSFKLNGKKWTGYVMEGAFREFMSGEFSTRLITVSPGDGLTTIRSEVFKKLGMEEI
jgi:hypothetical protein